MIGSNIRTIKVHPVALTPSGAPGAKRHAAGMIFNKEPSSSAKIIHPTHANPQVIETVNADATLPVLIVERPTDSPVCIASTEVPHQHKGRLALELQAQQAAVKALLQGSDLDTVGQLIAVEPGRNSVGPRLGLAPARKLKATVMRPSRSCHPKHIKHVRQRLHCGQIFTTPLRSSRDLNGK